ncbi:MAG TPA: cobyric acid synthase [Rhizobiaceae bacterium]|nr:cobyric acid synthase [Rhizobiaceae bacterium]
MARALMFQGTGSDVGKTVLVAGLCRAARRRGLHVLPFKPQNMSNNAAVADPGEDGLGGEIGRAQWLQALACGAAPSVHMNPVLLKPQSEFGSQVVVQGQVAGTARGRDYQELKPKLLQAVLDSFNYLTARADLVIVEGAGSPAEINLRAGDIANMGFATRAGVPVVLVGDIDRGGVIASLVGTHTILSPQDRAMIAGFLINKFRGDQSLFDEGLRLITQFTGWRSYGVLPFLDAVRRLPAEDSVALEQIVRDRQGGRIKIAVPVTSRIANFDDLDPLRAEPNVELVFVRRGETIPADAALIVLPGSKSTIADMAELRANGWEAAIIGHHRRGGMVIGICGGYQMLGRTITDPDGIEGSAREIAGLGLLDVQTAIEGEKIVRNTGAMLVADGLPLEGYEIHMGRTTGPGCSRPMIRIGGRADGAVSGDGRVMGCYLHGIFGADAYRARLLAELGAEAGGGSHRAMVEQALDELAGRIEECLDVDGLLAAATNV